MPVVNFAAAPAPASSRPDVRLLVTRPEPEAERTAALLRERGHTVLLAPLLRIEPVEVDFGSGPWAAVIITSANAVRALAVHPRVNEVKGLPVFAVGDRSAQAALEIGFANVSSAAGAAGDLVALVAARLSGVRQPLIYLAGEDQSVDIAAALAAHDLAVRTIVLYRAVAASIFPSEARLQLGAGSLDGVLHYSRRTAATYVACAHEAGMIGQALAPSHYCLSAQVADPLAVSGAADIRIAAHPDEAAMLALLDQAG